MNSKKVASVTVYRRPRKGFVPPRRVDPGEAEDADNLSPKEETGFPSKKRNLSPLFAKIRKKLEQDCCDNEDGSGGANEEMEVENPSTTSSGPGSSQVGPVAGSVQILEEFLGGEQGDVRAVNDDPFSNSLEDENVGEQGESVYFGGNEGDDLRETHVSNNGSSQRSTTTSGFRKPVLVSQQSQLNSKVVEVDVGEDEVTNSQASQPGVPQRQEVDDKKYYGAVFAKTSTRKHKKWEGDGYIIFSKGKIVTLKNESGKVLDSSNNYKLDSEHFEDGKIFKLGGKEVQIVEELKSDPFAKDVKPPPPDPVATKALGKLPTPLMNKAFVSPCAPGAVTTEKANRNPAKPMFDPEAPDALVMPILDVWKNAHANNMK